MLHEAIVVGDSTLGGIGLIAARAIQIGEITWRSDSDPQRHHVDTISSWPAEKQTAFYQHAWQVESGWFTGPKDGESYLTRSRRPPSNDAPALLTIAAMGAPEVSSRKAKPEA